MTTRTVVFDMDGTLVQTRAASWDVFQDTACHFELAIHSAEEFFELFTGNFYESLAALCDDPGLEAAVRDHFLQGLRDRYAPEFIPGMRDVVKELASRYPLAVMSSNAMGAIRRILEREDLAQCFAHVFAGDAGASKETQLGQILAEPSYGNARHCSPSYVEGANESDAEEVVLITDTVGDIREARNSGARAIGVAWGMHSAEALMAAGAESVAMWPQELLTTLLPAADGASSCGANPNDAGCRCSDAGACRPRTAPSVPAAAHTSHQPTPLAIDRAERPQWCWIAAAAAGEVRRQRRATATSRAHDLRVQHNHRMSSKAPAARPVPNVEPALAAALRRISSVHHRHMTEPRTPTAR